MSNDSASTATESSVYNAEFTPKDEQAKQVLVFELCHIVLQRQGPTGTATWDPDAMIQAGHCQQKLSAPLTRTAPKHYAIIKNDSASQPRSPSLGPRPQYCMHQFIQFRRRQRKRSRMQNQGGESSLPVARVPSPPEATAGCKALHLRHRHCRCWHQHSGPTISHDAWATQAAQQQIIATAMHTTAGPIQSQLNGKYNPPLMSTILFSIRPAQPHSW
jgi:hypothetical protein